MPELTDSYCERCGVRHVFSTGTQKGFSLRGARVLAKGLRNFVLNDGQSMGDSITTARLEDESGDSSRMTEAFHKAFNFCMTCRQYACDQCWNSQVGACLSCAPQASSEPVAPEGHLIVRTPVARWDPDWLNFADSDAAPAAGEGASTRPAGWPGPLQIDSIRPPQALDDLPASQAGAKAAFPARAVAALLGRADAALREGSSARAIEMLLATSVTGVVRSTLLIFRASQLTCMLIRVTVWTKLIWSSRDGQGGDGNP